MQGQQNPAPCLIPADPVSALAGPCPGGSSDQVTSKNLRHNTCAQGGVLLTRHAPAVAQLWWGDEDHLRRALALLERDWGVPGGSSGGSSCGSSAAGSRSSGAAAASNGTGAGAPVTAPLDAILLSDVVYGALAGVGPQRVWRVRRSWVVCCGGGGG